MNHSVAKPALVVLAAGMGSRYGGLKQIDPIGPHGEIILDYSIYDAIRAGFGKVVFVIRHDIESAFREAVGSKWEKRIEVAYAFQELDAIPKGFPVSPDRVKPWGTGHALLCAKDCIDSPFAVINADDFYGGNGFAQLADALMNNENENRHFMVGYLLRNTLSKFGSVSRGVCAFKADGLLDGVTECTKIEADGNGAKSVAEDGSPIAFSGDEIVSMNFWGFMPTVFGYLEPQFRDFLVQRSSELKSEFYLPASIANSIAKGDASVGVLKSTDSWLGVTYRDDKPHVQAGIAALIAAGVYPENLFA